MNLIEKIKLYPSHVKGLLMSNPYRNGEYKFLEKHVSNFTKNNLIFDVGANIGEYSEKIVEFNPNVKIYCFEPIPDTFKQLKNRHKNNPNIRLNNFAFSDKEETREMFEYGKLNGTNSLEKHPELISEATNRIKIPLQKIDSFCETNHIETIDYLKIDVEGHELNVLKGAQKMLSEKKIKSIQFEYNYLWKNTSNSLEGVFNILNKNYNLYRLTFWGKIATKTFQPHLESYPSAANYIALLK
ncbi:MAG: FkbM family methyltransferase [Flavobacteriales bacterium]